jgi:hypothetical protein
MNQIIDELVEINKQVNPAQVTLLINNIATAEKQTYDRFRNFADRYAQSCKQGLSLMKSFGSSLEADLSLIKQGILKANNRIKDANKRLVKLNGDAANLKKEIKSSSQEMSKEKQVWKKSSLEGEAKLTTIRHIRNIVHDELLNAKATPKGKGKPKGKSFLQVHVDAISSKLGELKVLVEKDSDPLFISVVNTLIQLSNEKHLNDQGVLQKFLNALKRLEERLRKFLTSSKDQFKRIMKLHTLTLNARLKSLRSVSQLALDARGTASSGQRHLEEFANAQKLVEAGQKRFTSENGKMTAICKDQARVSALWDNNYKSFKTRLDDLRSSWSEKSLK